MDDEELSQKKRELMEQVWTEDLHHALQELPSDEAKKIVESMTHSEIYSKVNMRQFQQDYIADYLRFLWDISEVAFWKHVSSTFDPKEGILWSDNMFYFEKLCNVEIPADVLYAIIEFIVNDENLAGQDLEAIGCVVKAQVERFDRLEEINLYISQLVTNEKNVVDEKINSMINCKCNYQFY